MSASGDVVRDIRTLRALNATGDLPFRELLYMGLGDWQEISSAVRRLQTAGYLAGDDRLLYMTPAGKAAIARLDDDAEKRRLLTELFYGEPFARTS